MQNPTALRRKLVTLARLHVGKTILYLGDDYERLEKLFKILDGTREVHDNAVFLRTAQREARELSGNFQPKPNFGIPFMTKK